MYLKTALICLFFAAPAMAQTWVAQPIEIDVAGENAASSVLVVAAFQPDTSTTPFLFGNADDQQTAVRAPDGSVVPSIILGRINAGQEADFGITSLLPQTVQEIGLRYDDVPARVALKSSRPDFFKQLVEEGHVDPPSERDLKVALQTELQRMNCYRSGIDGAWGPGSRRSVASYFDKREGADWPNQEPSAPLFRDMILSDDVRCEAPVVATTTRRAAPKSTRSTARKPTTRKKPSTTARRKRATPAPKPKISLDAGIGVFR